MVMGKKPELLPMDVDFDTYDLILIGSPVWASNCAPPIRTLLENGYIKGKKIAYFFSHDGGGSKVVGNIKGTIEMKNELIATKDFLKPLKFSKGCLKEAEAWAEEITKLV